ncbi:MAG: hypothetical protein HY644_02465 [Acidobacteria bacterium]|nr:hypothetical protein [Acidobacteriota bacterium]
MSQPRRIRVSCDVPERTVDNIEVRPDTSASQILEKAGLDPSQYVLLKKGNNGSYSKGDFPYKDITVDGEKLHATASSEVGALSVVDLARKLFSAPPERGAAARSAEPHRDYAADQAWSKGISVNGITARGWYEIPSRKMKWQGRAFRTGNSWLFQIYDPPTNFLKGTTWEGCFHPSQDKSLWYTIGWHESPGTSLCSGIASINRVLASVVARGVGGQR